MTESEWLESDDPNAMIHCCVSQSVPGNRDGLVLQPSTRKFRLFAAAAVRTCWNLLDRSSRAVVEAAERFADTGEVNEELFAASSLLTLARVLMPSPDCQETGEANAVVETARIHNPQVLPAYAALLRDVVGSPFRAVVFPCCEAVRRVERIPGDASTLLAGECPLHGDTLHLKGLGLFTPHVLALAEAAYRTGGSAGRGDGHLDPGALAALADALEEAGLSTLPCPNSWPEAEMETLIRHKTKIAQNCPLCGGALVVPHPFLAHLRSPEPHVMGCSVVDHFRPHRRLP